jgi:DNA-binding NarL/FixJ family response regulator
VTAAPRRALLLCPDLLLGSKVEALARAAGCKPELHADETTAAAACDGAVDIVVVDLGATADGVAWLERQRTERRLPAGVPALGFYAHTDDATRRRALAAGFALVVPRSRLVREGRELIERLLPESPMPS